jgi:hypothetical protein
MACQAASATASLREVLKVGLLCQQRILDPKKISVMALNSTRPERGTSLILYRGAVVMPRCSSKARGDCLLRAPCPNSGPRRWLFRCLCSMRRGHWPDPLPSSCSLGWWRPLFTAGCEESQSRAERSANECSALPPHQVVYHLHPGNILFHPIGLELILLPVG